MLTFSISAFRWQRCALDRSRPFRINSRYSPRAEIWGPCADKCAGHVGRVPATGCAAAGADAAAAAAGAATVRPCRVVRPQPSSGSTSAVAAVYASQHPRLNSPCGSPP